MRVLNQHEHVSTQTLVLFELPVMFVPILAYTASKRSMNAPNAMSMPIKRKRKKIPAAEFVPRVQFLTFFYAAAPAPAPADTFRFRHLSSPEE